MKRQWDIEELIEHFTLVKKDLGFLGNKSGRTRLGFALLLKCFQLEGSFPRAKHEIPKDVVNYVAHQRPFLEGEKQVRTRIFTCFLKKPLNLFRSMPSSCYTANAKEKQVKKQKQVKKHDHNSDSRSIS